MLQRCCSPVSSGFCNSSWFPVLMVHFKVAGAADSTSCLCCGRCWGTGSAASHYDPVGRVWASCGKLQCRCVGDYLSHAGRCLSSPGIEHTMLLQQQFCHLLSFKSTTFILLLGNIFFFLFQNKPFGSNEVKKQKYMLNEKLLSFRFLRKLMDM